MMTLCLDLSFLWNRICKTLHITLSQFLSDNDMVEMTDELKEFYDAWIALTPDKRKNILETMKMMK